VIGSVMAMTPITPLVASKLVQVLLRANSSAPILVALSRELK
jgi:hypothetical protein